MAGPTYTSGCDTGKNLSKDFNPLNLLDPFTKKSSKQIEQIKRISSLLFFYEYCFQ